jgi:hypothetical protein
MMQRMLTAERVRGALDYDPETGVFRWRERRPGVRAGHVTGSKNNVTGYLSIRLDGSLYYAHRLAWIYMTGEWPPQTIDHINLIRDDNRFANLRLATHYQNKLNIRRPHNNTSGFKGVHRAVNGKFFARLKIEGKIIHLGTFDTAEEAATFRDREARRLHGEFYRPD